MQKAFQDAATEAKITTDSVAFSFAADLDGSEIATAVKNLKDTEFRLFYVIAFEQHYNPIMTAAANEGIVGDDYLWIFDGFDTETFHKRAVFPSGAYDQITELLVANRVLDLRLSFGKRIELIFFLDSSASIIIVSHTNLSLSLFRFPFRFAVGHCNAWCWIDSICGWCLSRTVPSGTGTIAPA